MSGKQENASVWKESVAEVGQMHLTKCFGTGYDYKPCFVLTHVWFLTKLQEISEEKLCLHFFCGAAKTINGPPKNDVSREKGHYKPLLLNNMDGEIWCWFLVLLKNLWGCLTKGGWCCAKVRCCYREGRHQRVSQTTDSQTGVQRKSLKSLSDA